MSSHLLLLYQPTDHGHVCCLECLLFSSKDICLYQQYLFYVHSLLESSKTARCIAFGWTLKKYQVPIICLLSSYDIVRAQCWGTGSHRATHYSQDRGLTSQGLPHCLQQGCRGGWEGSWGQLPPQDIRHLQGDGPGCQSVGGGWGSGLVRGTRVRESFGMACALNAPVSGIKPWMYLLWVVGTGTVFPWKSIR